MFDVAPDGVLNLNVVDQFELGNAQVPSRFIYRHVLCRVEINTQLTCFLLLRQIRIVQQRYVQLFPLRIIPIQTEKRVSLLQLRHFRTVFWNSNVETSIIFFVTLVRRKFSVGYFI